MDNTTLGNMHKMKPTGFGDIGKRRLNEANRLKDERHKIRTRTFFLRRNIGTPTEDTKENNHQSHGNKTHEDRKLALQRFKSQREAIKKAMKVKEKPPFVVGIPHHGSSPVLKEFNNINIENKPKKVFKEPQNEVRQRRMTRAATRASSKNEIKQKFIPTTTKKNLKNIKAGSPVRAFPFTKQKSVFSFLPQKVTSVKKLTSPQTPTVLKRSAQKNPSFLKQVVFNNKLNKSKPSTSSTNSGEELAVPLPFSEDDNLGCTVEHSLETLVATDQRKQLEDPSSNLNVEELPSKDVLESSDVQIKQKSIKKEPEYNLFNISETSDELTDSSLMNNVISQRGKKADETLSTLPETPDEMINNTGSEVCRVSIFHRARLDEETSRLLTYVKKWEMVVLHEDVPSDVTDDIDSVVGLTRLLTSDKFSQFRGLIENFEKNNGVRPVTQDDLNGFWDMMYLQVKSLIKRYSDLENLRSNNWIQPQVTMKKKRGPNAKCRVVKSATSSLRDLIQAKRRKQATSSEVLHTEITPLAEKKQFPLLTTPVQIRSNSPSSFIAMRLSAAGRSLGRPSCLMESSDTDVTPKSILKKRIKTELQPVELKPMELHSVELQPTKLPSRKAVTFGETSSEDDAQSHGEIKTPRRSLRLQRRSPTPTPAKLCSLCSSPDCNKDCVKETKQRKHRYTRQSSSARKSPTVVLISSASAVVLDSAASGEIGSSRRSLRLQGRSPTSATLCSLCSSPDCHKDCVKENKQKNTRYTRHSSSAYKSQTVVLSSTASDIVLDSAASGSLQTEVKDIEETRKKFILRPSSLVINENADLKAIPKKNIRKKRHFKVEEGEDTSHS